MKASKVLFKFRISSDMLKQYFWLGLSTVFFISLAIIAIGKAEGLLGLDFFMLICLLQLYNISLHLKLNLMSEIVDASTELVDEVVDVVKAFADKKAAVLTPEQLKAIANMASDVVYSKMQEKVDKTAADLRKAIMDDDDSSEVAKAALKAIKHIGKNAAKLTDEAAVEILSSKVPKWKIKD